MSEAPQTDLPLYRLTIITKSNRELTTYGSKATLKPLLDYWIAKDWIDTMVMRVDGHMDTCDRAEQFGGVLMDEIEIMTMHLYA